ncbi:MAG: hypothetical protein ACKO7A_09265, partial [Microcystis sp.]
FHRFPVAEINARTGVESWWIKSQRFIEKLGLKPAPFRLCVKPIGKQKIRCLVVIRKLTVGQKLV